MTWEPVAVVLGGVALMGAALAALPSIGRFLIAAGKAPKAIADISKEFAADGNGSMRTAINHHGDVLTKLHTDFEKLRDTQHELVSQITAAVGTAQTTAKVVEIHARQIADQTDVIHTHTAEDSTRFDGVDIKFDEVLTRLTDISLGIDANNSAIAEAKALAAQVKADLGRYNEEAS